MLHTREAYNASCAQGAQCCLCGSGLIRQGGEDFGMAGQVGAAMAEQPATSEVTPH